MQSSSFHHYWPATVTVAMAFRPRAHLLLPPLLLSLLALAAAALPLGPGGLSAAPSSLSIALLALPTSTQEHLAASVDSLRRAATVGDVRGVSIVALCSVDSACNAARREVSANTWRYGRTSVMDVRDERGAEGVSSFSLGLAHALGPAQAGGGGAGDAGRWAASGRELALF